MQAKSNTPAYQNRCVLRLILYHVCVNLPLVLFTYPAFKFMGLRSSLPLPHWYQALHFLSPNYYVVCTSLGCLTCYLYFLQDGCCVSSPFLLRARGFRVLLGAPGTAHQMALQACPLRPPRVKSYIHTAAPHFTTTFFLGIIVSLYIISVSYVAHRSS
jgi:hypothetical protein